MTQLSNRTLFTGDNLPILRGMNSESVDLIYLDPPFNSNKDYSAPIGSEAAGAHFKDAWTLDDVDAEWHGQIADEHPGAYKVIDAAGVAHSKGMQAYLIMMAVRIIELQRILRPTGSIYLHVDPTASHYLKTLMDSIFGRSAYRNEIIWAYRRLPAKQENFQRMHDVVLRYASEGATWNQLYDDPAPSTVKQHKGRKRVRVFVDGKRMPDAYTDIRSAGPAMRDVWNISVLHPAAKERVGYPTQKPLTLLERIIRASSNEGDYVFDPFCGCATTLVAAEKLSRKWGGGADLSDLAVKLVKQRIKRELGGLLFDVIHRTDIPTRTDQGKLPHYRSHAHRLYGEQEGHCKACGTHFPFRVMHVDHIVPQSHGGGDEYSNLQMLCSGCNVRKGTGTHSQLLAYLRADGILQK